MPSVNGSNRLLGVSTFTGLPVSQVLGDVSPPVLRPASTA